MFPRSCLALSSVVLCVIASPASAFNPQPEPPGFGAIGIVSSQTARLNVSFVSPPEPDRGAVPPGPCAGAVQLEFVDATGNVVAGKTVRLVAGGSEALELVGVRGDNVGVRSRRQIRARVSWAEFPPGPCRTGALLGNVEVYDSASGETTFVLPGTLGVFQEVEN